MMLEKIYLIDQSSALITAWQQAFADQSTVDILCDDYFAQPADAMVSPANSFGIMDGGLDRVIRYELGFAVEQRVPEDVSHTLHAYLAFRAVLLAIKHHNQTQTPIRSLVCAGLGTGIGGLTAQQCAIQMKEAFEQFQQPAQRMSDQDIWHQHRRLHLKP